MLNRLFILSFACLILSATFLSSANSQQVNLPPDQEFDLLCSEVLMDLLSDTNGRKILKGQKPLPDEPLDMDLSFMWWESSKIFQWSQENGRPLWDQKNPNWEDKDGNVMTYGQKYEERTILPDMTRLTNITPLNVYVSIRKETQNDIQIQKPPITTMGPPKLVWSPNTKWKADPIFDSEKLSKIGVWRHREKESWWPDALISAAIFGVGYYLSTKSEPEPEIYFKDEDWKPLAPRCWTACALGEPSYKRPECPEVKMTPDEWNQNPKLSKWYVTPRIYYEDKDTSYKGIGYALMSGSATYAVIRIPWKLFHIKLKFFR